MRFFLTGFMGCGKSFWGQKLATSYSLKFIDLDRFIETQHACSVNQLFEEKGEAVFRSIEHAALLEIIASEETCIIATGGGTPCFYDNLKRMNEYGVSIYLHASPRYLVQRLINETSIRPLLKNLDEDELVAFVNATLAEREKFYLASSYKIDVENCDETIFEPIINQYV